MAKKNRLVTSGVAVVAAVGVLFGGTFAWQSISQTALNEVSASVNPGGRLHDDFGDITEKLKANADANEIVTMSYDKNVYVENFTEYGDNGAEVYARVRLDEYMELGQNAGKMNGDKKADDNQAKSVVEGAELADKTTWTTHKIGQENDKTNPFHQYWDWEMGGDAVKYMPTFNKNKDSLEADINGSFAKNFEDFVDYTDEETPTEKTAIAIYDEDADEDAVEKDELAKALTGKEATLSDIINAGSEDAAKEMLDALDSELLSKPNISIAEEKHEVKETLSFADADAQIISMADYFQMLEENEDWDGVGNYWVYDTDGWAYWAAPIKPESATAPLLNGISRTEKIINQDWYYAINVVAQFVTNDDMGQDDNTGFYDMAQGTEPSADALKLLSTIGVEVPTSDVADETELKAALELGGIVNVNEDIEITEQLNVTHGTVLNLNGKTITTANQDDVQKTDDKWSFLSVRDGATLTINDDSEQPGGISVPYWNDTKACYAIDVCGGSKLVINGGHFAGIAHTVYVHEGEAVINGGTFELTDVDDWAEQGKNFTLNCYNTNYENGTAKITVCGGSFLSFDPSNPETDDAVTYVPAGYSVSSTDTDDGATWYTVSATSADSGESTENTETDLDTEMV